MPIALCSENNCSRTVYQKRFFKETNGQRLIIMEKKPEKK